MKKALQDTIAFYDQNYAASTVDLDMQAFYDRFEKYLPIGASILDAGCGSGRDSKYFIEKGYNVTVFDASETMCECASKLIGQEVRHLTFQNMDYQECFDGIWACASLLHVPEDEMLSVLKKIVVALKTGGILYASWKNGNKERVDPTTGRFFCDMTETKIESLFALSHDICMEESWISYDIRTDYESQSWINIVAKKHKKEGD